MAQKDPLQPEHCAELLAALAAPERLKVVRFLAEGEHNVGEIADMLKIAPVNLTHHLQVLKHANLVTARKQGRFIWYSLKPGVIAESIAAGVSQESLNLGCCQILLPLGMPGGKKADKRD